MSTWRTNVLQKHLEILKRHYVIDIINKFNYKIIIEGDANSPYHGKKYIIDMTLTSDYPNFPPDFKFDTPIYHKDINNKGDIKNQPLNAIQVYGLPLRCALFGLHFDV
eukprot:417569_1